MTVETYVVKRSCVVFGAIVLNVLVWLSAALPGLVV